MKILRALHQTNVWLYSLFDLDVSFSDPDIIIPKVNNIIIVYEYIYSSCFEFMHDKWIYIFIYNIIIFYQKYFILGWPYDIIWRDLYRIDLLEFDENTGFRLMLRSMIK